MPRVVVAVVVRVSPSLVSAPGLAVVVVAAPA
jgi:hypothetical protein